MSGRHLLFFFSSLFSLSFFLSSLFFFLFSLFFFLSSLFSLLFYLSPTFTLSLCSFHQCPILFSRHRFI